MTLKTGVMMLKIQLRFIGMNYILKKYIKIENFYLYTDLMSIRNLFNKLY